jgi:glycosyltransferase involved in cell wall biosynthesis
VSSLGVLHISTYDAHGGAARAAVAVHQALLDQNIDSRMRVACKSIPDPSITQGRNLPFKFAKEMDRRLWALQRTETETWRSAAKFGVLRAREINRSSADIVHLHWFTDGFLTIDSIGKIDKPIVWSLCDAWAFSGTEHYAMGQSGIRSAQGYTKANRIQSDSGFDLDKWTWERKRKSWRTPMYLLPASSWLKDSVGRSALMGAWPTFQIPHVVDTNEFAPSPRRVPNEKPTLLFLTSGGIHDHRKGWDFLVEALQMVASSRSLRVIVVGPKPTPAEQVEIQHKVQHACVFHGEARGNGELIKLYQQADMTLVPSREDNMPLAAMESQSCGTPVVAFAVGGLPDIVMPGISGYLAAPENTEDFAHGIEVVLTNDLRAGTRQHAMLLWSPEVVVPQLLDVYQRALAQEK